VSIFSLLTGAAVKNQYLRKKEKYALFTGCLAFKRKKQPEKPQIINVKHEKKFLCRVLKLYFAIPFY